MKVEVRQTASLNNLKAILVMYKPGMILVDTYFENVDDETEITFFNGYRNQEGHKRRYLGISVWGEEVTDILLKPENEWEMEMIQEMSGILVGGTKFKILYTNINTNRDFKIIGEFYADR